jgi:hypothetical protein
MLQVEHDMQFTDCSRPTVSVSYAHRLLTSLVRINWFDSLVMQESGLSRYTPAGRRPWKGSVCHAETSGHHL